MSFLGSVALIALLLSGLLLMLGFSELALRLFTIGVLIAFLAPALVHLFSIGGHS